MCVCGWGCPRITMRCSILCHSLLPVITGCVCVSQHHHEVLVALCMSVMTVVLFPESSFIYPVRGILRIRNNNGEYC